MNNRTTNVATIIAGLEPGESLRNAIDVDVIDRFISHPLVVQSPIFGSNQVGVDEITNYGIRIEDAPEGLIGVVDMPAERAVLHPDNTITRTRKGSSR